MEKDKSGELDKKPYKGILHYASLTFELPSADNDKGGGKHEKSAAASAGESGLSRSTAAVLPPLPEPVASFGAAVADGWLYVYGGHTGEEHEHSAANLSAHFRRIRLDGGKEWQELPMQTHLQGLPLVTHGGRIYRVGGLNNRNATKNDKEDLHSTDEFTEYDPATNKWTALAPLPAARSSHNAAVIGDRLYVVGGWTLEGKSPGTWQPDALVYDFKNPKTGWQKLPRPDFKRRALAAGVWQGKLFAIGGMDEKGKPSLRVDFFDPKSGKWSQGPPLPGVGMAGFGASAWNLGGNLYVCGLRGVLYRLSQNGSAWEEAGRLETPRFFHQLVPGPHGTLLAVAGASMNGHIATIEQIDLKSEHVGKKSPDTRPL
jgi:N-acetylneuraminic acid mutarotase